LLAFNCWKRAGDDVRRALPLKKNTFSGVTPSAGNVWIFGGEAEFRNNHRIETLALHTTTEN